MYSTCLFCQSSLGRNDTLEHFPVGRRLAYDPAKGRLWVVCRRCQRWNLSPLESRWEAIEEAEQRFRGTRIRISTDNIALARLADGLDLVRIGTPPRLELAGWRYGDAFGRRRRRAFAWTAIGLGFAALPILGSVGVATAIVSTGAALGFSWIDYRKWRHDAGVATIRVTDDEGGVLYLAKHDAWTGTLVPEPGGWHLCVSHRVVEPPAAAGQPVRISRQERVAEPTILTGDAALKALPLLMPQVNPAGGSTRTVRDAVRVVESSTTARALIQDAIRSGAAKDGSLRPAPLTRLPARIRLAMEMVFHDEAERRAADGDLAQLEARWREAEEIAGIADALLLPADAETRLDDLRRHQQD